MIYHHSRPIKQEQHHLNKDQPYPLFVLGASLHKIYIKSSEIIMRLEYLLGLIFLTNTFEDVLVI